MSCPADLGDRVIVHFAYATGPESPVAVELTGCLPARNGHLIRAAGYLAGRLAKQTGRRAR